MTERWVCKRCFADNDESNGACHRCGLIRGAEASPADQTAWTGHAAGPAAPVPAWRSWLRYWWIPALAVVLAIGFFANARRDGSGALEAAGTVAIDELRAGDCFNGGEEELVSDVDGVPCTEPHEYEVFAVAPHEAESFPGDAEMEAIFTSVCEPAFESFVGAPYASSRLYASMITPSEESWGNGDRSFICILYDPEDPELTASMRGANR